MTGIEGLIDRYCEAWGEPDDQVRRGLLSAVLAPEATYTDPTVHTTGIPELLAHITGVQARRPGSRVVRTSQIDAHHGMARFAWHAVDADGKALLNGIDVVFQSADGLVIERIVGFFGSTRPLAG